MLTSEDVLKLVEVWENQTTEFKREFSTDPIRESLVSFSNDYMEQGRGFIIIGVDPKSKDVVGIEGNPDDLMLRITGLCRDGNIIPTIAPEMYPVKVEGKDVMVVEVKKSDRRPHRSNNICYIRIGSANKKATPDEEFELIRKSGRIPYDLSPVRNASLDDLDVVKFEREFLPRRVSSDILALNGRASVDWLENLKFVYKEGNQYIPTIAAILLFGKQPQDFVPHSSIDFIRFEGDDPSYPIADRKEITGSLDQLIEVGVKLVEQYMIKGYRFSERSPVRSDIYEYPLRAIREAIANAVVHRDYEFSRSQVSIKMFDDRVEILSPGGLFGIVTKENFGTGVNDYRNPTLAVGLNFLGLVEKAGTGIFLIKRQMRENGSLEPTFVIDDKYLLTKLPSHPYYQGVRLYQKGLSELESGNRDLAVTYFKNSTNLFPNFSEAWAALGRAEGLYGNVDEARKSFQIAIEKNSRLEKAYLDWGKMEELAGQINQSRTILRQGNQAIPDSWVLLFALGQLEQKQKNWEKSSTYFRQALTYQPNNIRIWKALGENALQIKDWDEAIRSFRNALKSPENDHEKGAIYLNLMKVLIRKGAKYEEIKSCFDDAYALGFKAHEMFSQYYRYLTSKHLHAEALKIVELAQKENYELTPYTAELSVGGFLKSLHTKEIKRELTKVLQNEGLAFSQILTYFDRKIKIPFAIIKTASDNEADRIVSFLNGKDFFGRRLTARRKYD
ncbi:MAG: hypothetical protein EPGJADBJ_00639 [Saprospiraceae bacterium]|nr:hypothetical protein [Saprospiraceae bacterium]